MSHAASVSSPELAPEMLSAAARAFLEWRPDGVIIRWNPGAERLFGYRADEAIDRDIRTLLGEAPFFGEPTSRKRLDGAHKRTQTAETRSTTKDGRFIRCRWTGAVLRDAAGDPRIIAVEAEDTGDTGRALDLLRASHELLKTVLDNGVSLVFVKDLDRRYIFVNEVMADAFGLHPMAFLGKTDYELGFVPSEVIDGWHAKDSEIIRGGRPVRYEESAVIQGKTRHYLTVKFPIHDASGKAVALCGIPTDITSLKRAEAERTALQEQIIASQEAALRELQTPLMPIADQVLAMPIVGAVDAARAAQIMETLLKGITAMRAHTAILDITGVRGINAEVAEALVRTARAARLLGARVVLTGIGPAVASALIELRVDIEGIVTRGTFQSGIAYALAGERA